jgi:enoyl-CoA hydratase
MLVVNDFGGPIARITLNRPEKLNALSGEMLDQLAETFRIISQNQTLRAIVLTGAGNMAFSAAGTDTNEFAALNEEEVKQALQRSQAVCDAIENCRVPVIAAVNGIAAGFGCELALACHLRVASERAEFSFAETTLSSISVSGIKRANELTLAGKTIKADEALRIGLVNAVVPSDQVQDEAMTLAQEIAKLAPLAVRACLQAVIKGFDLPLEEGLKLETELFSELFATEDMREGTRAFLEKRTPVFQGK